MDLRIKTYIDTYTDGYTSHELRNRDVVDCMRKDLPVVVYNKRMSGRYMVYMTMGSQLLICSLVVVNNQINVLVEQVCENAEENLWFYYENEMSESDTLLYLDINSHIRNLLMKVLNHVGEKYGKVAISTLEDEMFLRKEKIV